MMIRIFKDFAEFTLLVMGLCREENWTPGSAIQRFKDGNTGLRSLPHQRQYLLTAFRNLTSVRYNTTWDELIDQLGEQLEKANHNIDTEGAVIDQIIQLLGLSFGSNRIDDNVIKKLRRALLIPEDAAALTEKLEKVELHCGLCKRLLISGEMVMLSVEKSPNLVCLNCVVPYVVPCFKCGGHVDLDKRTRNSLGRVKGRLCTECLENPGQPTPKTGTVHTPAPPHIRGPMRPGRPEMLEEIPEEDEPQ